MIIIITITFLTLRGKSCNYIGNQKNILLWFDDCNVACWEGIHFCCECSDEKGNNYHELHFDFSPSFFLYSSLSVSV